MVREGVMNITATSFSIQNKFKIDLSMEQHIRGSFNDSALYKLTFIIIIINRQGLKTSSNGLGQKKSEVVYIRSSTRSQL